MTPVKNMLNDAIASLYDAFNILKAAQAYIAYYHKTLLRALLLPFTLFMTVALTMNYFGVHIWVHLIVLLVLTMKNAIVIHRVLLIGHESVPKWGLEYFNKRELRYVAFQILSMLVIAFLPLVTLMVYLNTIAGNDLEDPFAQTVTLIFQLLAYYIMARISLVFPATAIDRQLTIKEAWGLTAKHKITVVLVIGLVPYALTRLSNMLVISFNAYWLSMLVFLLVTIYVIAVLSVTYKFIIDDGSSAK